MTRFIYILLIFLCLLFPRQRVLAQCITTFPYTENFEASNGSWTPGGTASDWSWGHPIKPVINAAASGNNCWIVGTLTQSSYSNNQNSTLTSPCFDFSTLTSPYIRFNVFWETEKKYDGASFQYSIDGGNNWTTLGSYSDFQNCPADNWFNTSGITALGTDGWSGNIQLTAACTGGAGNGSGQWKIAQHEMFNLAGQPNVRFRFRFAAGSVCNNYDGFAIDDIWVGEFIYKTSNFNYNCVSANSVSFVPEGSGCSMYTWDFGDPASGADNTSAVFNPTHVFSGPGTYLVSCTLQIGSFVPPVVKQITITDVNITIVTPINCDGDMATIQAQVSPAGSYNYQWTTSPPQTTAIATGLPAGNYKVTVTGANTCSNSDNITLTQPIGVKTSLGNDTVICPGEQLILDAGNFASYSWQDGTTTRTFPVTQTGTYFVTVTDNNNCQDADTIRVTVDCSDIYFPSAFTPNGDGRNESFGPLGNSAAVSKYSLRIFNRWGQLVYRSDNPMEKWNGTIDGKLVATGSYAWFSEYTIESRKLNRRQKGTVTVIR